MGHKYDVVAEFAKIYEENKKNSRELGKEVSALIWNMDRVEHQIPKIVTGRILKIDYGDSPTMLYIVTRDDSIYCANMHVVVALS